MYLKNVIKIQTLSINLAYRKGLKNASHPSTAKWQHRKLSGVKDKASQAEERVSTDQVKERHPQTGARRSPGREATGPDP